MEEIREECLKALRVKVLFFSDSASSTWGPTRRLAVAEHRRGILETERAEENAKLRSAEEAKARALKPGKPRRFDKDPATVPTLHPRVQLANVFLQSLDAMQACENTDHIFDAPVDKEEFFDYDEHCPDGVDLLTIRCRVQALMYGSVEEFQQDVNKIVHNSIAYNGQRSEVTEKAKKMVEKGYSVLTPEMSRLSLLSKKSRVYDIYIGVLKMLQLQTTLAKTELGGQQVANAVLDAGGEASVAQRILGVALNALGALERDESLRQELETGAISDVAGLQSRIQQTCSDDAHKIFLQSILASVTETLEKEDSVQRAECEAYYQARLADPINAEGEEEEEGGAEENGKDEAEEAKKAERRERRKRKREKTKKRTLKQAYADDEEAKARKKNMDKLLGRGKEKDAEFASSEEGESEEDEDEGEDEEEEEEEDEAEGEDDDDDEDYV